MSGKEGKKFEKVPIGKVEKWLVDGSKEVGLDIDGYEHEITNEFVTHVMNKHGNEKNEKSRGQVAIKQDDFSKIPEIIKYPDYVIVGIKSLGRDMTAYAKKMPDGTMQYLEEVLAGKRNRSLRGKTMYKRKRETNDKEFFKIISDGDGTDMTNTKVLVHGAPEAIPAVPTTTKESLAVANSASAHEPTSNIPQSGEKSSGVSN